MFLNLIFFSIALFFLFLNFSLSLKKMIWHTFWQFYERMIQRITSAKNISGIRTPIWWVKLGNRVETGKVEGSRSCFTKSRSRATTIGWCLSTTCSSSSKSLRPSLSRQFCRHCYLAISVIFPKKVPFAEMAYHTVKMAHDHVKKKWLMYVSHFFEAVG